MDTERRRSSDQQLGYLTGKLEEVLEITKENSDRLTKLEDQVAEKFTTVETLFKVVKFGGLAIGAILTFKFGDVAQLWHAFFK